MATRTEEALFFVYSTAQPLECIVATKTGAISLVGRSASLPVRGKRSNTEQINATCQHSQIRSRASPKGVMAGTLGKRQALFKSSERHVQRRREESQVSRTVGCISSFGAASEGKSRLLSFTVTFAESPLKAW